MLRWPLALAGATLLSACNGELAVVPHDAGTAHDGLAFQDARARPDVSAESAPFDDVGVAK